MKIEFSQRFASTGDIFTIVTDLMRVLRAYARVKLICLKSFYVGICAHIRKSATGVKLIFRFYVFCDANSTSCTLKDSPLADESNFLHPLTGKWRRWKWTVLLVFFILGTNWGRSTIYNKHNIHERKGCFRTMLRFTQDIVNLSKIITDLLHSFNSCFHCDGCVAVWSEAMRSGKLYDMLTIKICEYCYSFNQ